MIVSRSTQQEALGIDRQSASQAEPEGKAMSTRLTRTMFAIDTREGGAEVVIMGRATRRRAVGMLNVPISGALRARLQEQVIGSIAMGSSALLEWALAELERQRVSIQAEPNS
jgi:hypothetical protein